MQYKLTQYIKYPDGYFPSKYFIEVLIDDEQGHSLNQQYWLNQEDTQVVDADESALNQVLAVVAKQGLQNLEYEKNPPISNVSSQPVFIADQAKLDSFPIKADNIK